MTDGSGKIGGNVAAKNRFGSYLRRKGQVLNPQTVAQQAVRMAFGALSQAWRSITDVQRAGWISLAPFALIFDQFGDAITLTGAQLYQKFNQNLRLILQGAIDDAPVLIGAAQLDIPAAVIDIGAGAANAFTLAVNNFVNLVGQNSSLYIEATPPVSSGRTAGSIKNLYRGISTGAHLPFQVALTATGVAILYTDATFANGIAANYVSLFGMPTTVDQRIFIRMRAINDITGESSPLISAVVVIIATP